MRRDVIIVGAGVTGLALAWALKRKGGQPLVLEASDRAGGVLHSEWVDGVCVERGPQALRGAGGVAAEIIESLGLIDRLRGGSPAAGKRFLLHKGKLWAVPGSPVAMLGGGPLSAGAVVRALAEPLVRKGSAEGETLHDFVSRRLGGGIADPLVEAFVGGIYAGDSRQLEASSSFPKLTGFEDEHGSILLGAMRSKRAERPEWLPKGMFTFDEGADVLVRALAEHVGDDLELDCEVTAVEAVDTGFVVRAGERTWEADQVVLAVAPSAGARIDSPYREAFAHIPASPVAAVTLAWPRGEGPPGEGFGWLSPSSERRDALGAIWVSSVFPHLAPERDVMRVMLGGSRDPELPLRDPQELRAHALEVLRSTQGPCDEPVFSDVQVHREGIPQYVLGHGERKRALTAVEGLHAVGWGVTGIGVTQCLDAAAEAAERMVSPSP